MIAENVVLWLAGLCGVVAACHFVANFLSSEARDRRRRRRNYGRVISRARRPAVMLRARTERA
jgi:hypothetical protein